MLFEKSQFLSGGKSWIAKDGAFDIASVAPGSYRLMAFSSGGKATTLAFQIVNVGEADVNGVVLTIVPPGSLHGRIRAEGAPAGNAQWSPANARVDQSVAGDGPSFVGTPQASPKQDGTFVFEDVSIGIYNVGASNGPDGAYLKSIRLNDQDVLNKDIDFSQGVSGELEKRIRLA